MLEKLVDPKHKLVGTPSPDAMLALGEVMARNPRPNVAEIGVGIGATTLAMAQCMAGMGQLYLFDFEETVGELKDDLAKRGFQNVSIFGNSTKTYDSYSWNLAKLRLKSLTEAEPLRFDFVYLDGAHAFHHDATAAAVVKEMIAKDGYLLMDDYTWTFNSSPTMNPKVNARTAASYTEEQLRVPHVRMVCDALLDPDDRFRRDDLSGKVSEFRALYRRIG